MENLHSPTILIREKSWFCPWTIKCIKLVLINNVCFAQFMDSCNRPVHLFLFDTRNFPIISVQLTMILNRIMFVQKLSHTIRFGPATHMKTLLVYQQPIQNFVRGNPLDSRNLRPRVAAVVVLTGCIRDKGADPCVLALISGEGLYPTQQDT